MADKDLSGAKILYEHNADYGLVLFHIQQAVEKYLKGYLIYKTGRLQEGHSLIKLCKKAATYNNGFKNLVKDCAFLNGFYMETRYPAEDPLLAEADEVEEGLKLADGIIEFIKKSL